MPVATKRKEGGKKLLQAIGGAEAAAESPWFDPNGGDTGLAAHLRTPPRADGRPVISPAGHGVTQGPFADSNQFFDTPNQAAPAQVDAAPQSPDQQGDPQGVQLLNAIQGKPQGPRMNTMGVAPGGGFPWQARAPYEAPPTKQQLRSMEGMADLGTIAMGGNPSDAKQYAGVLRDRQLAANAGIDMSKLAPLPAWRGAANPLRTQQQLAYANTIKNLHANKSESAKAYDQQLAVRTARARAYNGAGIRPTDSSGNANMGRMLLDATLAGGVPTKDAVALARNGKSPAVNGLQLPWQLQYFLSQQPGGIEMLDQMNKQKALGHQMNMDEKRLELAGQPAPMHPAEIASREAQNKLANAQASFQQAQTAAMNDPNNPQNMIALRRAEADLSESKAKALQHTAEAEKVQMQTAAFKANPMALQTAAGIDPAVMDTAQGKQDAATGVMTPAAREHVINDLKSRNVFRWWPDEWSAPGNHRQQAIEQLGKVYKLKPKDLGDIYDEWLHRG